MSLSYRQQHQLRRIEARVRRSDPHLGAMFGVFGRLYAGEDMPTREEAPQVPVSHGRLQQGAAWIMAVLVAMAATISVLLSKGAAVAPGGRRGRARALVAERGRIHRRAHSQPPRRAR